MPANRPPKILVAGGGVSGLETVLALQSLAPGWFDIEVLAPERHFVHRPPTIGAPFEPIRPIRSELSAIAEDRGFDLTRDALDRVDAAGHEAVTQGGDRMAYDVLVLALGARPVGGRPRCASVSRLAGRGRRRRRAGEDRPGPCPRRVRRSLGRHVDASAVRARAADRGLGEGARRRRRRPARDRRARAPRGVRVPCEPAGRRPLAGRRRAFHPGRRRRPRTGRLSAHRTRRLDPCGPRRRPSRPARAGGARGAP